MAVEYIDDLYKNLPIPVILCKSEEDHEVVYLNSAARVLLDPAIAVRLLELEQKRISLSGILAFEREIQYKGLLETLKILKSVKDYEATVVAHDRTKIQVTINASAAEIEGQSYFLIYLYENPRRYSDGKSNIDDLIATVFHMAYHIESLDEAIGKVLAMIGSFAGASRAYIFEDIGSGVTRNTYEWCGDGINPEIGRLQNLKKKDYPYDTIIEAGVFVVDDIRLLPEEAGGAIFIGQGIRSLAIVALYKGGKAIGFVGFDDCGKCRSWKSDEIFLLRRISDIIVSMITRRNSEEKIHRSYSILQTITDNIDSIVHVNSISDYTIKFVNEPMARSCGKSADEMVGRKCWEILQKNRSKPCRTCPIQEMLAEDGSIRRRTCIHEYRNVYNGRWYLLRCAVINWIDGEMVMIETGTEITYQKQCQEELEVFASMDMMTHAYNREWGYKIIREMMVKSKRSGNPLSLCFIDLDDLKLVNDTYGHDMGDEMIMEIVNAIRSSIRRSDMICRWGGDEFILVLECDMKITRNIVGKIEHRIAEMNKTRKHPFWLSFSYGITDLTGSDPDQIDALISQADKLMYENKLGKRALT